MQQHLVTGISQSVRGRDRRSWVRLSSLQLQMQESCVSRGRQGRGVRKGRKGDGIAKDACNNEYVPENVSGTFDTNLRPCFSSLRMRRRRCYSKVGKGRVSSLARF